MWKLSVERIVIVLLIATVMFFMDSDKSRAETIASGTGRPNSEDILWTLEDTGTMKITGDGFMPDYWNDYYSSWKENKPPWYDGDR